MPRWPRRTARAARADRLPHRRKPFRDALIEDYALSPAPDALFELIGLLVGGERRQKAKALAAGQDPDGDAATLDVLAALEKFAPVHPDPRRLRNAWSRCSRVSIPSPPRRS
jgi:hypothetical protein